MKVPVPPAGHRNRVLAGQGTCGPVCGPRDSVGGSTQDSDLLEAGLAGPQVTLRCRYPARRRATWGQEAPSPGSRGSRFHRCFPGAPPLSMNTHSHAQPSLLWQLLFLFLSTAVSRCTKLAVGTGGPVPGPRACALTSSASKHVHMPPSRAPPGRAPSSGRDSPRQSSGAMAAGAPLGPDIHFS